MPVKDTLGINKSPCVIDAVVKTLGINKSPRVVDAVVKTMLDVNFHPTRALVPGGLQNSRVLA